MHSLNRAILRDLATIRLEDARVLLANERYAGAYYVAGYAIECALKACMAKQTRRYDFPDKKTVEKSFKHRAGELVGLTDIPLKAKCDSDVVFERYWKVVLHWTEESRYDPVPQKSVEDFFEAIDNPDHGVFQWLREHW